jgi:hypothetical protein
MNQHNNINVLTGLEECISYVFESNINVLAFCRSKSKAVAVCFQETNSFFALD